MHVQLTELKKTIDSDDEDDAVVVGRRDQSRVTNQSTNEKVQSKRLQSLNLDVELKN